MAASARACRYLLFAVLLMIGLQSQRGVCGELRVSHRKQASRHRSLLMSNLVGTLKSLVSGATQAEQDEARTVAAADAAAEAAAASGEPEEEGAGTGVPSKCPGRCTQYGTCNEELARCDCPLGFNGTDCSNEMPSGDARELCAHYGHTPATCFRSDYANCVNGCNFRGRCIGGFCHCKAGYYGADCSLSLDPATGQPELLAGQGYAPRAAGPRIYVYELPPHLNIWQNMDRLDRPLMFMVWQRLLSGGVRVADPATADFYFVPVRARLQYDSERIKEAVSYIGHVWPYWNATAGERHLFVHTGDWGRDELSEEVAQLTVNATWLTHWGLARDHDFAGWEASHRPGRDIVLPLFLQHSLLATYRMQKLNPLHPMGPKRTRSKVLFFAGRICGSRAQPVDNGTYPNCPDVLGKEDAYSAATRQRTYYYHHNRTNWKVVTASKSYASDLLTSKFCLSPTGGGQGKRSIVAVLMGCVPITVTDGLLQPFEPEMRWDRFAIDMRERDIPIMSEVLESLKEEQVKEFQSNLQCAAQHLFWSSMYGSLFGEDGRYDAFETLVQVLRMRALYPGVGPEEYTYVDADFEAFMRCQPPPQGAAAAAGGGAAGEGGSVVAAGGSGAGEGRAQGGQQGAGGGKAVATPAAGGVLDSARPELHQVLVASGQEEADRRQGARQQPRALPAPASGKQELCSYSELPTNAVNTCNKCARRRGRLLNPGGTICCNTKDLARCPRFWD